MSKRYGTWTFSAVVFAAVLSGCSSGTENAGVVTEVVYETTGSGTEAAVPSSGVPSVKRSTAKPGGCRAPVIALDPGHNPVTVAEFDEATGVAMRDYSNGAEDADVMAVAEVVKTNLEAKGYTVVLLKESVDENVSYRERVGRAEDAGADVGVSLHTYTNDHRIFVQRVGLSRSGIGADGQPVTVTFTNAETARKSQKLAGAMAAERTAVEGREVVVTDNSFDGRAPLWGGDIPMIALISEQVPWVYHEFGTPGGGGSAPIGQQGIATYAEGVTNGVVAALPNTCGV